MLPDDFAQSGFHGIRVTKDPQTRFQVMGERSSGTNFIKRLIGRNTPLKPSDELGWKHGFCQMLAVPRDLTVVCVVRNPESWALSMFNKPWHASPDLQRKPFSEFIRAPWTTVFDRPRYLNHLPRTHVGQPLQQDRHPITGQAFASLFALRTAKMAHLMSFLNRNCNCIFLRLEEAQTNPEETFVKLNHALQSDPELENSGSEQPLGQVRPAQFRPVKKPQGWRFKSAVGERARAPAQMSEQDRAYMWSQLDRAQEARLGYAPR